MRNYIVHTSRGIYHVRATSADKAKDAVYKLTFGRVSPADMFVEVRS